MALGAPLIVAEGLRKRFGKIEALRGLSLSVPAGRVVVLLGPNGAGKTTLVRILSTLLRPDAGTATVAGLDVVRDATRLRRVIGLAGQSAALDDHLTGRENLTLVARLYHLGTHEARERTSELLARVGIEDAADRPAKGYSGGMRRRLDLAASIIGRPKVVFLDEPTTGLDPPSRLALWDMIDQLRRGGTTILMTTQNLEEADRLADTIAVVDHGTIIAQGTASELKAQLGGDVVEIQLPDPAMTVAVVAALDGLDARTDGTPGRVRVAAPHGARTLAQVVLRLDERVLQGADVSLRRPTLDDVFLALTGRATDAAEGRA